MPRFTATDGTNIYFEDVGEGFPLVFLHPWPTDHAMWMLQVPEFSEKYRVITPDSRGLGKSDRPAKDYSLRRLSDDVADLLESLGDRKGLHRWELIGRSSRGEICARSH